MLDEILQERLDPRGHRRNIRGVKRKMSNFPLRRRNDKHPPSVNIQNAIRMQLLTPNHRWVLTERRGADSSYG